MENKLIVSPRFFKVLQPKRRKFSLQKNTMKIRLNKKGRNSVRLDRKNNYQKKFYKKISQRQQRVKQNLELQFKNFVSKYADCGTPQESTVLGKKTFKYFKKYPQLTQNFQKMIKESVNKLEGQKVKFQTIKNLQKKKTKQFQDLRTKIRNYYQKNVYEENDKFFQQKKYKVQLDEEQENQIKNSYKLQRILQKQNYYQIKENYKKFLVKNKHFDNRKQQKRVTLLPFKRSMKLNSKNSKFFNQAKVKII